MNLRHSDEENRTEASPGAVERPITDQAAPSEATVRVERGTRRFPWQLAGAVALLLAVASPGAIWFMSANDDLAASSQLDQAAAAYRATGLPWTPADVVRSVPASQNAAPGLDEAYKQLKAAQTETDRIGDYLDFNKEHLATATMLGHLFDGPLATASRALRLPDASWGPDWRMGHLMDIPEPTEFDVIGRAFLTRAEIRAKNRDVDGALGDLRDARRIVELAGREPVLYGLTSQNFVAMPWCVTVQRIAEGWTDDLTDLKKLAETIETPSATADLISALRGQALMDVQAGRNPVFDAFLTEDTAVPQIDPSSLVSDGLPSGFSSRANLTRVLQTWTRLWRFVESRPNDPASIASEMKLLSQGLKSQTTSSYRVIKDFFPQTSDSVARYVDFKAWSGAQEKAVDALVHALMFCAETGRFPTSIDQVPGSWIDPYTRTPFKIRPNPYGGGIRVYGPGPTRVDHKGLKPEELNELPGSEGDVVATYPAPDLYLIRIVHGGD